MAYIETNSRVGADGKLHIDVPSMANTEVRVRIEPATMTNGTPTPLARRPPRTKDEWREFVRSTAGSMPDFPDLERPGPDSYEKRDLNW